MSLAERLRQRRSRDIPILQEALVEALVHSDDEVSTWPPSRASIAVEPLDGERIDPLADMLREELKEAPLAGLAELRAAALMVSEGLARRVILSGFETWPGLLAEMERLSEQHGLSILPAIGRQSGRIDLVVSREDGRAD